MLCIAVLEKKLKPKTKSKVQTVLKSTKLLHEHTKYLLIYMYVHVCILRASWSKKAKYCELKKFGCLPCGHWNQRCLENGAKFKHWMSQNLK